MTPNWMEIAQKVANLQILEHKNKYIKEADPGE